MNDFDPPTDPAAAPAHPAPPSYIPLSGIAITAFVLSLVLGFVALLGLWISELIPLLLGILGITTIRKNGKRGRLLAIFAIFIAFGFGSCCFMVHSSGMDAFSKIPESLLTALSATSDDEAKDAELEQWAWPEKLEGDPAMLASWRANYDRAVAAYGPWQEELDIGVPWLGFSVLFLPPSGVVEIGGEGSAPGWTPGCVIWVPAKFEQGVVHVAVVLQDGTAEGQQALRKYQPDTPLPIVGDVRFFHTEP